MRVCRTYVIREESRWKQSEIQLANTHLNLTCVTQKPDIYTTSVLWSRICRGDPVRMGLLHQYEHERSCGGTLEKEGMQSLA
jgi:hypothetical protein